MSLYSLCFGGVDRVYFRMDMNFLWLFVYLFYNKSEGGHILRSNKDNKLK